MLLYGCCLDREGASVSSVVLTPTWIGETHSSISDDSRHSNDDSGCSSVRLIGGSTIASLMYPSSWCYFSDGDRIASSLVQSKLEYRRKSVHGAPTCPAAMGRATMMVGFVFCSARCFLLLLFKRRQPDAVSSSEDAVPRFLHLSSNPPPTPSLRHGRTPKAVTPTVVFDDDDDNKKGKERQRGR